MQMTIPNVLSLARIAAAPFLLLAGYYGSEDLFFILFSLMLISDVLDGYLARKLHQCSKIGSRLDSIGDYLTYLSVPFATWWLWPEIIKEEAFYITAVITLFLLPGIIGLIKFHQMITYHTWVSKIMAVFMSVAIVLLLFVKDNSLFHLAVFVLAVEAAENILITLVLKKPQTNVGSLWHVLHQKRKR
jgi:CDP-diacylglycerol--glycerol-3-phosphate 3-phosphatidyltransferase